MDKKPLKEKEKRFWQKPFALLLLSFFLSRFVYFLFGIRYDASPLSWFWQYLDPYHLVNNLTQSLFYLHIQPPLFNLYLGIILKVCPHNPNPVFSLTYLLLGLILTFALFSLMKELGVSEKIATIFTTLFITNPSQILYENWLFYTYPLITFLVLSALSLIRFLKRKKLLDGLIFFSLISAIALIASFFHIVWVTVIILLLFAFISEPKLVIKSAIIPFALLLFWYSKNLIIFQTLSASSWLGMNLAKTTTRYISLAEQDLLLKERKITGITKIPPFSPLPAYQKYISPTPLTGIPVLDEPFRTGGEINFNHIGYLTISRLYLRDDIKLIFAYPKRYLRSLLDAFLLYFVPASSYRLLKENQEKIPFLIFISELFLHGRFLFYLQPELERENIIKFYWQKFWNMGIFLLIIHLVSFIYGLQIMKKNWAKKKLRHLTLTIFFLWFTLIYVLMVGNFLEVGENARFRSMVDSFSLTIFALFLSEKVFPQAIIKNKITK